MKNMQLIWVITDNEDNNVVIAASSNDNATQQLFDYMGYTNPIFENTVKYHGFKKYEYSEYEDDYVGHYEFESLNPVGYGESVAQEWQIDKFNLFCKVVKSHIFLKIIFKQNIWQKQKRLRKQLRK